jgi:hypothetical protein
MLLGKYLTVADAEQFAIGMAAKEVSRVPRRTGRCKAERSPERDGGYHHLEKKLGWRGFFVFVLEFRARERQGSRNVQGECERSASRRPS